MIVSGIGRVSTDIELLKSKNGNEYVAFSFAHERGYGEKKVTDWYNCRVLGEAAKRIANMQIKKGTKLHIAGELEIAVTVAENEVKQQRANINVVWWNFVSTGKPKATDNNVVATDEYVPVPENNVVSADDELPLA